MKKIMPTAFLLMSLALSIAYGQEATNEWERCRSKANSLLSQGRYNEAMVANQQALILAIDEFGAENSSVASIMNNLGYIYYLLGDLSKAEEFYKSSLIIMEGISDIDSMAMATCLSNLAALYRTMRDYEEAEHYCKRGLALTEKALGREHINVARSLYNLALLYSDQNKFARAESLYHRSLSISERAVGSEHPAIAEILHELAYLYL